MATNLKKLFEQHVDQISKHPRVNIESVRKTRYIHEFDREVQGPCWGYPTEGAYYRDASSTDALLAVRIPFFALHAKDDPIAVDEAVPYQAFRKNPFVVICSTFKGGHLSWFEPGGGRWFVKPITGFLNKFASDVDLQAHLKDTTSLCNGDAAIDEYAWNFDPVRRKLHYVQCNGAT